MSNRLDLNSYVILLKKATFDKDAAVKLTKIHYWDHDEKLILDTIQTVYAPQEPTKEVKLSLVKK
jgi:hypothetical protein